MWVEELRLKNIKCFEEVTLKLGTEDKPKDGSVRAAIMIRDLDLNRIKNGVIKQPNFRSRTLTLKQCLYIVKRAAGGDQDALALTKEMASNEGEYAAFIRSFI